MTTNIAVFGFGAILILVAILGGGFELKEFKVPRVGWAPRVIAGISGVLFVLWGVGISGPSAAKVEEAKSYAPTSASALAAAPENPVEFTIHDEFGQDGRLSEQITISIDGKFVGQLTANQQDPRSMLTVTEPRPGRYSYSLFATKIMNINGTAYRYEGTGQGMITVDQGKKFELVEGTSGDTWLISLVEQSELEKTK